LALFIPIAVLRLAGTAAEWGRSMSVSSSLQHCPDLFSYQRRESRVCQVGRVGIGGANPVRVQSMLTSDTRDAQACIREALELASAGCEIVRVTAQTRVIAENLREIAAGLRVAGCEVPLVADIHFKPDAAMEAVKWVEKIRVNPGNYADKKKFVVREYTDEVYAQEVEAMAAQFIPLVDQCIALNRAMRIGTNHGSLSDRIMNRFGDTPLGMVESALEFARIARGRGFHNFIFSMKASNPKVMISAYRLLVARLRELGSDWNYPLHLGVTEAGDGEDGRIKSAIGIGSLLLDGIGDTVRVSLTEDAVCEIPVARALVDELASEVSGGTACQAPAVPPSFDPFVHQRRASQRLVVSGVAAGASEPVRVFTTRAAAAQLPDPASLGLFQPELVLEEAGVEMVDPRETAAINAINGKDGPCWVSVADGLEMAPIHAFRLLAARIDPRHPILLKDTLATSASGVDSQSALLRAAATLGALLCDGIGDAVLLRGQPNAQEAIRLSYNILQGAGVRIFKTDYVACPSCGRTLFNLQSTTQNIRRATGHLKGVRIAVMGCIVNGPGEMADADFGYVGGAPGKINLYVGKTPVKFNIPEAEAVQRLIDLIREHGRWVDPDPSQSVG
jgi:(E)-4-hydroxy-3-methylbut-2-enyl-diphosphate synthase